MGRRRGPQWEAYRSPRAEYVRRELGHDVGAPLPSPQDTALAWKLAKIDPHSYERAQLEGCEGGAAGSHGRYMARKRAALLHYQIAGLTASLALAGPDDPVAVAAERAAAEAKGEEVVLDPVEQAMRNLRQREGARLAKTGRKKTPRGGDAASPTPAPPPRSPSSGGGMSADAALLAQQQRVQLLAEGSVARARQGPVYPAPPPPAAPLTPRAQKIKDDLDAMEDGGVGKKLSEGILRLIDVFRLYDTDGDGVVTRGEFKKGMKKLGLEKAGADAMNGLFDRLDRDKSGTISYHELKKLASETGAKRGALQL